MTPTRSTKSEKSHAGPMSRWLEVLGAFSEHGDWGVRDLALATSIPRSAVHRIVHEMIGLGLLADSETKGRFRVGPELVRLSARLSARVDIRRLARPILERTSQSIGETVVLAIYDPRRRRFAAIDAAETDHAIRYIWESLQAWGELHVGSSGKGILAFLPEPDRREILDSLPDPVPGRRPVAKAALRRELAAAARIGFVISHGERYEGAVGVSAPFRDAIGHIAGDLIATWPDNRTSREKESRVGDVVRRAADELSGELGWASDASRVGGLRE